MSRALFRNLSNRITTLQKEGVFKEERVLVSPQGIEVALGTGQWVLNLSSSNYLGLADDPDVIHAAEQGLREWGFGMASVRFVSGTQEIHRRLETALAAFLGTEQAMLFSSCFAANAGVFEALLGKEDVVISDERNHASIHDGITLSSAKCLQYRNNDMGELEAHLIAAKAARYRLIVTEGVFAMDGSIADLRGICDLADKYDALVMVDDSHAVGVLGQDGSGTADHCGVTGRIHILNGTLGKALGGASGGYVAARSEIVGWLRQRSRPYLFSNSLAPSIAAASLKALELVEDGEELRRRLRVNSVRFRIGLEAAGFKLMPGEHPILPILIGDVKKARDLAALLLKYGVYVVPVFYPLVPEGDARIRVQISAAHTLEQLEAALAAFQKAGKESGVLV